MGNLTKLQIESLKLQRGGKKLIEIANELKAKHSSVQYATKSGEKNIESAIHTIEIASKESILSSDQIYRLKQLLASFNQDF